MTKARDIITYMESLRDEKQRENLMRFFKTAPGEYGYGDEFLGLKVPQTREVVKMALNIEHGPFTISEVPELLMSKWHEVRLCGFLILVAKFEKLATKRLENDADAIRSRDEIVTMYLKYAEQANNWDLVDLSAPKILGGWLISPLLSPQEGEDPMRIVYKRHVLDELAQSDCLWKQRMSIVCTWKTLQQGDPSWCLRYAEIHLHHPHDLMHKAVGWMLREMGKRVSMDLLRDFLRQHAHEMPRTMLRYAIEKMSNEERKMWMSVAGRCNKEEGRCKREDGRCLKTEISPFAGLSITQFVDIILHDVKHSDEAVYYLLHHRIDRQLREIFDSYRCNLIDGFDDILDEFFLYLREGIGGNNRFPYHSIRGIRKKDSFEVWLLKTFRNYLSNRVMDDSRIAYADISLDNISAERSQGTPLTDERKLYVVAHLIAYALQVYYPRGRFVFLRSLLTMLNKQKAMSNVEMAKALGMTDISYRVMVHRMKRTLEKFRYRLQQGECLRLDDKHQQVAQDIYDNFEHLYLILLKYYTQTIDTLKCAAAVNELRQKHYETTGIIGHDNNPDTIVQISISMFWNKLDYMLKHQR